MNDSTRCKHSEDEEEDKGDGEENYDETGGSFAHAPSDGLDLGCHGGHWSRGGCGGGRDNTAAVVCLHHCAHLTLTLYHLVFLGASTCDTLGKFRTLISIDFLLIE